MSAGRCYIAVISFNGPAAVRYPRGSGTGIAPQSNMQLIPIGKAKVVHQGKRVAILAFGPLLAECQHVAKQLDATLVDMRFVKPLDAALLTSLPDTMSCLLRLKIMPLWVVQALR